MSDSRSAERGRLIVVQEAARKEALERLHRLQDEANSRPGGWTDADWQSYDELARRYRVAADEEWWLLDGGDPWAPLRVVLRDE